MRAAARQCPCHHSIVTGPPHKVAHACRKVIAQNGKFYGRFPGDAEQVRRIVRFLIAQPEGGVRTPSGNLLSPRGLQSLGCPGACTCFPTCTQQQLESSQLAPPTDVWLLAIVFWQWSELTGWLHSRQIGAPFCKPAHGIMTFRGLEAFAASLQQFLSGALRSGTRERAEMRDAL